MEFKHPQLGLVQGVQTHDNVVQYRGIPYGAIHSRFSKATLVTSLEEGGGHGQYGIEFGPQAPQPQGMMEHELEVFGGQLACPPDREPPMDEFKCLNLVVTAPSVPDRHSLPVFFWIHGGNLVSGGNWFPSIDATKLVARSVELGSPIIVVSINYRLGFFALLKSLELKQEIGTDGNLCFHDQVLALEWVREYIAGFGGSASDITCAGESAGAGSTHVLLMSNKPLFNRAILMSGSAPLMGTLPDAVHESMHKDLMGAMGLGALPAADRLQQITGGMSMKDIMAKIPPHTQFKMGVDGDIIKHELSFELCSTVKSVAETTGYCKALMAGELADDSSILTFLTYSNWPDPGVSIHAAFKHFLGEDDCIKILSVYGLHPPAPKERALWAIHDLVNDLAFALPMFRLAKAWPHQNNAFFYRVDEPITWDHLCKGRVPHVWDVALLFGNFQASLTATQQAVSKDMQTRFIRFIAGETPAWTSLENDSVYCFGGIRSGEGDAYQGKRRFRNWEVIENIGHDRIWFALGAGFLASGPKGFGN